MTHTFTCITLVSLLCAFVVFGDSPNGAFTSETTLTIQPGQKDTLKCSPGNVIAVTSAKTNGIPGTSDEGCKETVDITGKVQDKCDWQESCVLSVKTEPKGVACEVGRPLDLVYQCREGEVKPIIPTTQPPRNNKHRGIVPVELLDK
ncbi:hypothetical protein BV898_17424 [Hypsibius exemplaris]|uniref:SUEL-type lectin domain-containing protein n=1 Tax=Hypsibius exemplaris TaxID=2072580 RepID=A0A9X6RMS8_HYPEX|nr:hypothetical protein BV898_17424 [Hypsibius exemplaris]